MDAIAIVAFADVRPIAEIHTSIRAIEKVDPAEPGIVDCEQVRRMPSHIAGSLTLQDVVVHSFPMIVHRVGSVAVVGRPVVSEVDHEAAVRMPTSGLGGSGADTDFSDLAPHFPCVPVKVVSGLLDELI